MPALLPEIDPDGLLEYSVVFTDHALNHMSQKFQRVMRDLSGLLRQTYQAQAVALVPGGGSFGMEAVARQFATGRKVLVIRNGWFSFRWSQIFEMGHIPAQETVLKARPIHAGSAAPFSPPPLEEVLATIHTERPQLVFAPHVETASGIILPESYMQAIAQAVHAVGGLFVLDCVASGAVWVNMQQMGVDVLISAPQKGWSGSPSCAFIMFSPTALEWLDNTTSTSFAGDLKKWRQIMQSYEADGHAYHATMPTDALTRSRDMMLATQAAGLDYLCERQWELGRRVRHLLAEKGFQSVAAPAFEAPGVVVAYTQNQSLHTGQAFLAQGLQTAAGVPLRCDEPADFKTFRIGLFGLDKLTHVDRTVAHLAQALERMQMPAAA